MALLERVRAVLEAKEWVVETDDDAPGGLVLQPSDGPSPWPFLAQVGPDDDVVAFYSVLPDQVEEEHREAVSRVLTAANYGLAVGTLEMDVEDGDVQLRTSVDLAGVELDDDQLAALVSRLVIRNLSTMELWIEPLEQVAAGADPAAVVG